MVQGGTEVGSDEWSTQINQVAGPHKEELMQPDKENVFATNELGADIFKMLSYRIWKRRSGVNLQYKWRFQRAWEHDWQIERC